MVGIIVISESKASREMLKTVKKVLGQQTLEGVVPLVMDASLKCPERQRRIVGTIKKLKTHDGVLILTELCGSTQNNVCVDFLKQGKIEIISGYNLPMLIKVATLNQSLSVSKIATEIAKSGKKYIHSFKKCEAHGKTHH